MVANQPTQVVYPWRATLRTFLSTLPLTAAGLLTFIDIVRDVSPDWVVGWGPIAAAISLIITRTMQSPAVNALLTAWGLGPEPRSKPEISED